MRIAEGDSYFTTDDVMSRRCKPAAFIIHVWAHYLFTCENYHRDKFLLCLIFL